MDFQVARLNRSSYQDHAFFTMERLLFEKLNITYSSIAECQTGKRTLLISNTHSDLSLLPPKLKNSVEFIYHPNSGHDNFTLQQAQNYNILVDHTLRASAVAEFILAAIFQHWTPLTPHNNWNSSRRWNRPLLKEKSAVLLGHGHIGKILAKVLRPLLKDLTIIDPFQFSQQWPHHKIDLLVVAAGLNSTSRKMVNREMLDSLTPDFLLINAARGELLCEDGLQEILSQYPTAFAYLDVFEQEPQDFSKFEKLHNIHLTSHIAGVYKNLNNQILAQEEKIFTDFLQNTSEQFLKKYAYMNLKQFIVNDELI